MEFQPKVCLSRRIQFSPNYRHEAAIIVASNHLFTLKLSHIITFKFKQLLSCSIPNLLLLALRFTSCKNNDPEDLSSHLTAFECESLRNKILAYAEQWENYANINYVKVSSGTSEIRMTFDAVGNYSVVGKDD